MRKTVLKKMKIQKNQEAMPKVVEVKEAQNSQACFNSRSPLTTGQQKAKAWSQ